MKHRILSLTLIITFFILFQNSLKSQDYFPFPTDSATWYSMYSWPEMIPPYVSYYTIKYEIIDDTILNNKTYHKVYNSIPDSTDSGLYYLGGIRTEPDSLLVYYIDEWDSEESLIYNYNLVPNDTIIIRSLQYICIDTGSIVLNNGINHKIQYMYVPAHPCLQRWVIGIGSLGIPLLEPYWNCAYTFELSYDMTCFSYKNELIYEWEMNPYFTGCIGSSVIGIEEHSIESLQVVPNPVQDVSRLSGYKNDQQKIHYRVIDYTGRTIYGHSNILPSEVEIKRSDYSPGISFLEIYSNDFQKVQVLKFLIK